MKVFRYIVIVLFSINICSAHAAMDTTQLRQQIMAEFTKEPSGTFAAAFKDLSTGQQFFINEHDNFHAASTMKTPVLIETFRQASLGKFAVTDSILVKNTFASIVDGSPYSLDSMDDSERELYTLIGTKLPISNLLYRMITKSSNLSTNIIIDLVGAKNVTSTMRKLGANDIQVLRGVEDDKAFEKGLNNTTTAYDLMIIMEHIANGSAVSKKACDDMIKILMDQHFRDIIPAKLPPTVKVASKSGSITAICHDSGIVFLPNGKKYVVVLLSRGVQNQAASTEVLATVSKIIYDHVTQVSK